MKSLLLWMSFAIASSGLLAQVNCFNLNVQDVFRDPFDENYLVVQLQNPQFEMVSYPGVRIYDAETDLLIGEEVVNFFGIAGESVHLVPIELEIAPAEIYSLKIEIWSNFYENLECTFTANYTLYPQDFCTNPEFFVIASPDGISESFTLEVFSEGESVFTDNFTISDDQVFYTNDSLCLPSGCYQAVLGISDAMISLEGTISLEAGPYIGVPSMGFSAGDVELQFEFSIFDCAVNTVSDIIENNALRLFPNPASDQLSILFDGGDGREILSITDVSGRVVVREPLQTSRRILDVSGLPAGLYVIRLDSGGVIWTERFVKE